MKKSTVFYSVYFAGLLLLVALGLEWGSTVILSRRDQGSDPGAGGRHLYHPYRSHQLNPDYVRAFDSHNLKLHSPDGFRSDAVVSKDKPAGVFRIIMMGGSALYGIGAEAPFPRHPTLKNDELISFFLQRRLNEQMASDGRPLRIEVINAAVTSYTTFHHLIYFNEVLYEYSPDLVVFFDGHNDFYNYSISNNWQNARGGTGDLTHHFNQRGFWFASLAAVRYLANYSRFFMALEKYMQSTWPELPSPRFVQSAQPRKVETRFPENVDVLLKESIFKSYVQFQALGKLFGFDMIVFLQPQIALEKPERLSSTDRELQAITAAHENNPRRAQIRPYFAGQFEKFGIPFEDVSEIASAQTQSKALYVDYCHLSPAGSAVAADRMFARVLAMVNQRRPAK